MRGRRRWRAPRQEPRRRADPTSWRSLGVRRSGHSVIRPAHRGAPVPGRGTEARRVAAPECATARPRAGAAQRHRRHPAQRPEPRGAIREHAPQATGVLGVDLGMPGWQRGDHVQTRQQSPEMAPPVATACKPGGKSHSPGRAGICPAQGPDATAVRLEGAVPPETPDLLHAMGNANVQCRYLPGKDRLCTR